jgi:ribosomal protein S6
MRRYETIVIFSQQLNDTELRDEIAKYQKFIESNAGTIEGVDNWGRRELAYLMHKERFGSYVCYRFNTENHDLQNKLIALLNLSDTVLFCQGHVLSDRKRKVKVNPHRKPRTEDFEISIGDDLY